MHTQMFINVHSHVYFVSNSNEWFSIISGTDKPPKKWHGQGAGNVPKIIYCKRQDSVPPVAMHDGAMNLKNMDVKHHLRLPSQ